jgi:hypothetical protein
MSTGTDAFEPITLVCRRGVRRCSMKRSRGVFGDAVKKGWCESSQAFIEQALTWGL